MIYNFDIFIEKISIDFIDYVQSFNCPQFKVYKEDLETQMNIGYLCYLEQIDDNEKIKLNTCIDVISDKLIEINQFINQKDLDKVLINSSIVISYFSLILLIYTPKKMTNAIKADVKNILQIISEMDKNQKEEYFKFEIENMKIDLSYSFKKINKIRNLQDTIYLLVNQSNLIKKNNINDINKQIILNKMQVICQKTIKQIDSMRHLNLC